MKITHTYTESKIFLIQFTKQETQTKMQSLDYIIQRLGEKQIPYKHQTPSPNLDLSPYPIDFLYLGRSLHRFPSISKDFKIVNIETPTLSQAILFAIYGGNPNVKNIKALRLNKSKKPIPLEQMTPELYCQNLNINLLILGPDEEQVRYYKNQSKTPFKYSLVYHDYYDHYYPIISLEKQEVYLYDETDNSIQELIQLATTPTF